MRQWDAQQIADLAACAPRVGSAGLYQCKFGIAAEQYAEVRVQLKARQEVFCDFDAADAAMAHRVRQGFDPQLVKLPHSITFGTRYRPSATAGALRWLRSRSSVSVTLSLRRRRLISCTADKGE